MKGVAIKPHFYPACSATLKPFVANLKAWPWGPGNCTFWSFLLCPSSNLTEEPSYHVKKRAFLGKLFQNLVSLPLQYLCHLYHMLRSSLGLFLPLGTMCKGSGCIKGQDYQDMKPRVGRGTEKMPPSTPAHEGGGRPPEPAPQATSAPEHVQSTAFLVLIRILVAFSTWK